ncbi:hypothetical protein ACJIZ3_024226 [Penstemon smallii]|uniref:Uncharacterized protein n=1 Tax=Penstemon smallii TaxID=265156 RepID=A0ABD3TTM7_9LAMI
MWQVLLAAAAAAGSGILAKKLINPNDTEKPISDFKKNDQNEPLQSSQDSIFHLDEACLENSNQEKREELLSDDDKIFRFSSLQTTGFKELGKKSGSGFRKNGGGEKRGKKIGVLEGCERKGSGKKISVCLKKRRTGKHATGKCESCASKDNSFGYGVGVGIMYMMSAGKAEMSKLNHAMDETAKTVQELKTEISKRKNSVAENEAETNKMHIKSSTLSTKSKDKLIASEEGEYASSVLTEDQQPEVLEMDQLEAELESELQKLPWCAMESEVRTNIFEAEVLEKAQDYNGVLPAELDEKLCHLLIGQQGSQIEELETELQKAHSKLQEKDSELQALKDCVKRLTQFSLTSASGMITLFFLF